MVGTDVVVDRAGWAYAGARWRSWCTFVAPAFPLAGGVEVIRANGDDRTRESMMTRLRERRGQTDPSENAMRSLCAYVERGGDETTECERSSVRRTEKKRLSARNRLSASSLYLVIASISLQERFLARYSTQSGLDVDTSSIGVIHSSVGYQVGQPEHRFEGTAARIRHLLRSPPVVLESRATRDDDSSTCLTLARPFQRVTSRLASFEPRSRRVPVQSRAISSDEKRMTTYMGPTGPLVGFAAAPSAASVRRCLRHTCPAVSLPTALSRSQLGILDVFNAEELKPSFTKTHQGTFDAAPFELVSSCDEGSRRPTLRFPLRSPVDTLTDMLHRRSARERDDDNGEDLGQETFVSTLLPILPSMYVCADAQTTRSWN